MKHVATRLRVLLLALSACASAVAARATPMGWPR